MKHTFVFLIALTGCASTTVLPHEDGSYTIVSQSHSANGAVSAAQKKAAEQCKALEKKLAVIRYDSKYQGADRTAKAVIGAVSAMSDRSRYYHDGSRWDDYEVELHFKCQ